MPSASSVVSGDNTVAPAGAFSTPLKTSSVSVSAPPRPVRLDTQPGAAKVNLPAPLVVAVTPLPSHSTVMPEIGPSMA